MGLFFHLMKTDLIENIWGIPGAGFIAVDFWVPVDCGMVSFVDWTYFQDMQSVPLRLMSRNFRSLVKMPVFAVFFESQRNIIL